MFPSNVTMDADNLKPMAQLKQDKGAASLLFKDSQPIKS